MKVTEEVQKKWENLDLSNDFIFKNVLRNPDICKRVLSEIMGHEIEKIEFSAYEKTIDARLDSKGVRLDVYVKDEKGIVYNVEMQSVDKKNIKKRGRYYHSLIDLDLLEKGADYEKLNKSVVIFVCKYDVFGLGRYQYTFHSKCEEENLDLEDESTTIFLNTKGTVGDISDELKIFLKAIDGIFTSDEFSAILEKEVANIKNSQERRADYMLYELNIKDAEKRGLEIGIERGREELLTEKINKKLEKGKSIKQIAEELEESVETIEKMLAK